jgi:hypothetical protein
MIRNVRNFWIAARADGGASVATGPRAADGGMDVTLFQRIAGSAWSVADIRCRWRDGALVATFEPMTDGARDARVEIVGPDGTVTIAPRGTSVRIVTAR